MSAALRVNYLFQLQILYLGKVFQLTNLIPTANIFLVKNNKRSAILPRQKGSVPMNHLKKNILQDLSDRTENSTAIPALSKAKNCQQCEGPAGSH